MSVAVAGAVATDDAGAPVPVRDLADTIRRDAARHGTPVVIDLFCGIGGAARGFHTYGHRGPGWLTLGVDHDPEKTEKYPGYFLEADLTEGVPEPVVELLDLVDVAWASPPCQFATGVQYARSGQNHIPLARQLLVDIEQQAPAPVVTVIENVPGARDHLQNPVQLCGSAFGLGVQKHRVFETNYQAYGRPCDHPGGGFDYCIGDRETPKAGYRQAHGFAHDYGWTTKEIREAIPPAYVHDLIQQYQRYAPHESVKKQGQEKVA